jgi:lipopolysaccharide transport system permease protein
VTRSGSANTPEKMEHSSEPAAAPAAIPGAAAEFPHLEPPDPHFLPHGTWRTLREIADFRELTWGLTSRELRQRYKSSALGLVWSTLNPLALMLVYWLLFSVFFPNGLVDRFPVYMLLGLIAWNFFAGSVATGSMCLVANASIVTRVAFPRQIVPSAVVLHNLINMLIGLAVVVPFLIVTKSWPDLWSLQIIPITICMAAFVSGLTLFVAAVTVFFRDVEHLLTTLLFPLFFATPILWEPAALGLTGKKAEAFYYLNPVTPYVAGFRDTLYNPAYLGTGTWIYVVAVGAVALFGGAYTFSKLYDEIPTEL